MKFKSMAVCLPVVLSACGGGSGSDNGVISSACSNTPVVTAATSYFGVTPDGEVGTWYFDTSARTVRFQVGSSADSGSLPLTRDDSTCSYTSTSTGALRMALTANGLGLAAGTTGSGSSTVIRGAMVMANPSADPSAVAGTYNVMRYETDSGASSTVTSSYATLGIDSSGGWRLCPNEAYSSSCSNGVTGSLVSNSLGGLSLQTGASVTVGRVFIKSSGTQRVLFAAIHDTTDSTTTTDGMWIGSTNEAFVSGQLDGVYITNTNEQTTGLRTLAGSTLKPDSRTAVNLLTNNPVTGLFEIVTGDPVNDLGMISAQGIYADLTPTDSSTGTPFIRFGVKQ